MSKGLTSILRGFQTKISLWTSLIVKEFRLKLQIFQKERFKVYWINCPTFLIKKRNLGQILWTFSENFTFGEFRNRYITFTTLRVTLHWTHWLPMPYGLLPQIQFHFHWFHGLQLWNWHCKTFTCQLTIKNQGFLFLS